MICFLIFVLQSFTPPGAPFLPRLHLKTSWAWPSLISIAFSTPAFHSSTMVTQAPTKSINCFLNPKSQTVPYFFNKRYGQACPSNILLPYELLSVLCGCTMTKRVGFQKMRFQKFIPGPLSSLYPCVCVCVWCVCVCGVYGVYACAHVYTCKSTPQLCTSCGKQHS